MSVLAIISVLALLIVVHEAGHFFAARLQGIHVNRFSIGFGPILWKYQGPETEYAIRAFPLGGFVGFPDDDPETDIPKNDPDLLRNRPILDRAIVISAGVIANLVFAYLVFVVQFAGFGIQDFIAEPGVLIPQVVSEQNTPALKAGIQPGDLVLAVNGKPLADDQTSVTTLKTVIQNSLNQPVDLTIERDSQQLAVTVTPERNRKGDVQIGVQLQQNGTVVHRAAQPLEVFTLAAKEFQAVLVEIVNQLTKLATHFSETAPAVVGPVGIVQQGASLAKDNILTLFPFTALISINLALINILPLPALDGGQLAFLLIEALRGKPLPLRVQENVMQTGLFLLLGLGVFLIVRDTINLPVLEKLLQ